MEDYRFKLTKILKAPENRGEDLFLISNLATTTNQKQQFL